MRQALGGSLSQVFSVLSKRELIIFLMGVLLLSGCARATPEQWRQYQQFNSVMQQITGSVATATGHPNPYAVGSGQSVSNSPTAMGNLNSAQNYQDDLAIRIQELEARKAILERQRNESLYALPLLTAQSSRSLHKSIICCFS